VIDSVGAGVDPGRVGRRVWVFGTQSYRPFGTAAQLTVVPDRQAVDLPATIGDDVGAALGIPGITAHRAVFADGPVTGRTILVHGVLGGVGSLAAQLATWAGATVVATVRHHADLAEATRRTTSPVIALDDPDPAAAVRHHAPADDLTTAAGAAALSIPIADPLPLERAADARDLVDTGTRERILLAVPG
jgi:NADPH:quinone reductase